jgi:hypothetical protein
MSQLSKQPGDFVRDIFFVLYPCTVTPLAKSSDRLDNLYPVDRIHYFLNFTPITRTAKAPDITHLLIVT